MEHAKDYIECQRKEASPPCPDIKLIHGPPRLFQSSPYPPYYSSLSLSGPRESCVYPRARSKEFLSAGNGKLIRPSYFVGRAIIYAGARVLRLPLLALNIARRGPFGFTAAAARGGAGRVVLGYSRCGAPQV